MISPRRAVLSVKALCMFVDNNHQLISERTDMCMCKIIIGLILAGVVALAIFSLV